MKREKRHKTIPAQFRATEMNVNVCATQLSYLRADALQTNMITVKPQLPYTQPERKLSS